MDFRLPRALWAIAAACQIAASPAAAGTLEVAPTTVALTPGAKAGVFYVNNYGSDSITVQIEPLNWSQLDGRDQLSPSDTLMVSPPIAAVPAQGKQTIRLLTATGAEGGERSYRLLVSELPDPAKQMGRRIQVLTQFSIPVFVSVPTHSAPDILWSASLGDGQLSLTARNQGQQHVKLTELQLVAQNGNLDAVSPGALNYILAGSSRSWNVRCAGCASGASFRIEGRDEASGAKIDDSIVIRR